MTTKTKEQKVHIDDLHFEHQRWEKELKFFLEELPFFQARLEEVAKRYTDKDVLKELDHFQNQLYIERNAMDDCFTISTYMSKKLHAMQKSTPVAVDHVLFVDHGPLRDRIDTNRKLMPRIENGIQSLPIKVDVKWT